MCVGPGKPVILQSGARKALAGKARPIRARNGYSRARLSDLRQAGLLHRTITIMRDIFTEVFESEPVDPMEAARRGARPKLRARFYQRAEAGEAGEGGVPILLDGRPVRTPAKALLAAPSRALAQALAAEWDAQRDMIDPARMPLTRLANAIIDGVVKRPAPVAAEIEKYLGSDLLFYRAGEPEGLVASQARHWDPILQWARETFGARFVLAQGITFVAQPAEAVAAAAKRDPAASLAARRGELRDRAHRLGAARARARAQPARRRRGVGRRACRRGLEHGKVGPRRAGARAARASVRGNAGGGTSPLDHTSADRSPRRVLDECFSQAAALSAAHHGAAQRRAAPARPRRS